MPTSGIAPKQASPVTFGSVGTLSGPAASTFKPAVEGAQLWVKYINGKGGLNGHAVRAVLYDDGADPSRHRAQVQDAVERQNVLGFLLNAEALTGQSSVEYLDAKRVPVIGTASGVNWVYSSPMYFSQASDGEAVYGTFLPSLISQVPDKKKVGYVTCIEAAAACDAVVKVVDRQAKDLGLEVVYQGRASIAQPDYTAECISARRAGAEMFMLLMDSNSTRRLVSSCVRQGYRPVFFNGATNLLDDWKEDPNLEGFIGNSQIFPYFQKGTPATDEFQQVILSQGKGLLLGVGTALGWTAGKLLEKAGAKLPEPPTREALLDGLWSIKNDTLGGLTLPLTFHRDRPATPRSCWFNIAIKNASWVSPDGVKLQCYPA